jgi:methylmalonyl-CoA mutase C-terminal domain/subunit
MVVDAALQEDAQVIGLSITRALYMTIPRPSSRSWRRKVTDIVVFGGGIIPDDDIAALRSVVWKIFTPGTPLQDIVGGCGNASRRSSALASAGNRTFRRWKLRPNAGVREGVI